MSEKEVGAGEELLVLHERWVQAARRHLREIVAVVVGVVLLLSLWAGYKVYQERREGKAALLYARALSLRDRERALRELSELIKRYPGTVAAREARLNLWEKELASSPPDKLLKELRRIEKENVGEVKFSIQLGKGYLLETEGNFEKAVHIYEKILKEAEYTKEIVYPDLARAYEKLGNYEKALSYYQEYLKTRPPSGGLNFIEYKLRQIKERLARASS